MAPNVTTTSVSPKILQLLPALESGGVEQITLSTCYIIAGQNWEQAVASSGGALVERLPEGCAHYRLPLKNKGIINFLWAGYKLHRLIIKEQFNIIHVRSRFPAWAAQLALKILKLRGYELPRVISTVHGAHSNGLCKIWYNRVMVKADVVTTVSRFMAGYIRWAWRPPIRIEIIHDAVDVEKFSPQAELPNSSPLESLGTRPIILLPGRISRSKGGELLLRAFAGSRARVTHQLLLVGKIESEKYYQELLDLAAELRVSSLVTILGPQKDLRGMYKAADLVIVPSTTQEAFGLVTAEAMAMARPVIATALGASRELITHKVTGWLVCPDVDKLAKTIDHALELPAEARAKIGEKARDYICEKFNAKSSAEKWVKLYNEIL